MSNTGKGATSIKKDILQPGSIPKTGYKSLRWKHQASAGDTVINIQSLTVPAISTAKGFVQPSAPERATVDHFQYMNNFRLESSLRMLSMPEDYRITGAQTIVLEVAAAEGEIFTGVMMAFPVSGNTIVDANTDPISVVLPAGQTDISIGTYDVGKNTNAQHGQYTVHEDGQLVYRNFGNQSDGEGSYYELDGIIRFNTTSTEDRNISLIPTAAIVHAPDNSLLQKIQTVSGKVDSMIPTLAAEAGVPESTFGGVSDPDIKAHGARVVQNEADIAQNTTDITTKTQHVLPYVDSGVQTLSPTIFFNLTIPAGTVTKQYRWIRTGKVVDLWIWFRYDGAAATNDFFYFDYTTLGIPTPENHPNASTFQQDTISSSGNGGWGNGGSVLSPATCQFLQNDRIYSTAEDQKVIAEFHGHIRYITSD